MTFFQATAALAALLVIAGCSSSNSSGNSSIDSSDPAVSSTSASGDIVIRNHGLNAPITFLNVVASDDLTPDFEANLLDSPLSPGTSITIASELCEEPVDWRTSSGTDFVFSRSNQSFACGEALDIFVNPDPFVAPESERGILIIFNNAITEGNVLLDVELRRTGIAGAEFGPGRLADGEILLPGDDADFDASPCNIAYDIRLRGVGDAVIDVIDNTFIQCDFETEVELVDDRF